MRRVLLVSLLLVSLMIFAGKVVLRYGIWDEYQVDGVKKQIEAFEAKHPNIKVKLEVVPWDDYWVKLQTMMAGGTCWDVFWMDTGFYLKDYVDRGVLVDITPYIEKEGIDLSNYPKGILKIHEYKERYYSLPRDYDTIALFYNKDMFDKAGLKYPDETWTWTDLILAAEKLTIKDEKGRVKQWGIASEAGALNVLQAIVFPLMLANGADLYDEEHHKVLFNTPEAKAAVRMLYDLTKKGFAPKPYQIESDPFIAGKAAMIFNGSWMLNYYDETIKSFRWGVAPLPIWGKRATVSDSLGNVIWVGTKHKEEAWEFVKFLASKEAAEILGKMGTVIPAYKGTEKYWLEHFKGDRKKDAQVFLDSVEFTYPFVSAPGQDKWWDRFETFYMNEILSGKLSVDEGLDKAVEEINRIIEEAMKR